MNKHSLTLYLLRAFAFLKRFSGYTHPMGFHDSIFNITINSAAVLKHSRLKFTGNVNVTEEHNKREIWVVGRSGCGLSINMKYVGKGTNAFKNCASSQHAVRW